MEAISQLTTDLRGMLESSESELPLDERGKHWPFKNKDTLGKTGVPKFGPPPASTRSVKQTDDWVCKRKGKYVQICKSGDRKKIVRINKGYKKNYNKAYRAWKSKKKGAAKK